MWRTAPRQTVRGDLVEQKMTTASAAAAAALDTHLQTS